VSGQQQRRDVHVTFAARTPDGVHQKSEVGEIAVVVVDDGLGFVYYGDERFGMRSYRKQPR
jgi:hypothetical protein